MADNTGNKTAQNYSLDIPQKNKAFYVKGAGHYDWGMQKRLSHIFKEDGRTVMLAFDHGYFLGPTSGLERLDLIIPSLMNQVDCLMGTRGALRAAIPVENYKALALRASAGSSVISDDLSNEEIGVDMEDALRLDADCVAIQTFIGSGNECHTIKNLTHMIDSGYRYSMPVLGVVAVGKQMERNTRFFLLATRMLAEFGAQIIKSYYCDDLEKVVAACPVPIIMAGGKKLPEKEALEMTYNAISQGVAGVDMGRNVFQSECPTGMLAAINSVVHSNATANEAYELYLDELNNRKGL